MDMPFPVLRTERLLLREPVASDAGALFEIHSQNKFMPWYGALPIADPAAALSLIERAAGWRRSSRGGWAWTLELAGQPVGHCALHDWRRDWRSARLEFELSHGSRGQGVMREALTGVLAYGFGVMRLHRVEARVHHLNLAAMRLLRGLGFVQEGCLREAGCWDGVHHDLLLFSLLEREHRRSSALEERS